jgi:hypothetical protein
MCKYADVQMRKLECFKIQFGHPGFRFAYAKLIKVFSLLKFLAKTFFNKTTKIVCKLQK